MWYAALSPARFSVSCLVFGLLLLRCSVACCGVGVCAMAVGVVGSTVVSSPVYNGAKVWVLVTVTGERFRTPVVNPSTSCARSAISRNLDARDV